MIEYKQGATRRVLLVGGYAIKFAKLHVLTIALLVLRRVFDIKWLLQKIHKLGTKDCSANTIKNNISGMLFSGLYANRQEDVLYKNYPELPLAQVHCMLFCGLVLVMARGTPVPPSISWPLRKCYIDIGDEHGISGDLDIAAHVCQIGRRLVFIDFGHPDAKMLFSLC